jgi:hypothetical protein
MNKVQHTILSILKNHIIYSAFLGFTLLFFLYKGFGYLIIRSYIPLILLLAIVVLFIWGAGNSKKTFKKVINIWAILLIIWSSSRILLSLINQFVKQVPQSHISEQLGTSDFILSLLFLSGAIYLLRYKKRVFEK